MRPRVVIAMFASAAIGTVLLSLPQVRHGLVGLRSRSSAAAATWNAAGHVLVSVQKPPPPPTLRVPVAGVTPPTGLTFVGWSLLDRKTGQILGHSDTAGTGTNYTESMIKAWIAADFLGRLSANGGPADPNDLAQLRLMIIHSDDNIASRYYNLGGRDTVITRLNQVCGVHTHVAIAGWWSYTAMTPDDGARLGQCLATGTAAGRYTDQLLGWMREVTGTVADQPAYGHTGGGRWGIIDGLPAELATKTSIKNGWEPEVENHVWHVNCLAILPEQVLTVMVRYPWVAPGDDWHRATNLKQGADACRSIAAQLVVIPEV